jgi:RimJ/RimL family protein N-acetyltransferase
LRAIGPSPPAGLPASLLDVGFPLETERLVLRGWQAGDLPAFRELAGDPRVMRFVGSGSPWSDLQIETFLERQRRQLAELGYCMAALVRREDGALVGQAGLQPLGSTGDVEIGWWLRPDCWGCGLASEAARALVRFGFGEAGLARIVAIARPENRASLAVMERLGMRRTGRHTGHELGLRDPDVSVVRYVLERQPGRLSSWERL